MEDQVEPNESQFKKAIENIKSAGSADRSMLNKWAAGKMSAEDYSKKTSENIREKESANYVLSNTSVQDLTDMTKGKTFGFEVSGDALARAKKGKPSKVER